MSQNEWLPQEDILNNVIYILNNSFIADNNIQKDIQAKLCCLENNADIINYFLLIFEDNERFDGKTRALAGLMLKNNIAQTYDTIPSAAIENLKTISLKLLHDSSKDIRASASAVLNILALKGGIENWIDLFPNLLNLLKSSNADVRYTVIKTLINICEDSLSNSKKLQVPIKELLTEFIVLTTHADRNIKFQSFSILNECLQKFYNIIKADFNSTCYLECLMNAANDPGEEITMCVCQGFIAYINNRDEVILPILNNVIKYMILKTNDKCTDVALQACEFWYCMARIPTCKDILGSYLKDIVPLLLNNMKYSEYELNIFKCTIDDDLNQADHLQDIKPFAKYNNNDIDDSEMGWTLRKCSASSLDSLSLQFEESMTEILVPLLMRNLESDDLLLKESGILALGAMADGCFISLIQILPTLIPPLIQCMEHPYSLIRSISCWTLSRYLKFIIYSPEEHKYFIPVMMSLLQHCLDQNKRVQRSAISAFCFFLEEAKTKILPYIDLVAQAFVKCFEIYKTRSLNILYDAISVLAGTIIQDFKKIFNIIIYPLMRKFNSIEDYHSTDEFLAICECLASLVIAVDVDFMPFTEVVFHKCICVISETLQLATQYECEEYEKDSMSGVLDLLVSLASSLKTYFVKFIINSNLMDQLFYVIQDEVIHVRQPGLALLGEIVQICYPFISNQIHVYIPVIIENLEYRFNGACNNAAWVIGKLCIAMENGIAPYAGQIVDHCCEILRNSDGLQIIFKTVSIALCTLGLVCSEEIAVHLKNLLKPICISLRNVGDCEEKEIAFRGLCQIVIKNPDVLAHELIYFCDAIASWNDVNFELRERIKTILIDFKIHIGDANWNRSYDMFPELLKSRLHTLYDVQTIT